MSTPRAPDGKPFPPPFVAVDSSEQLPFAMGFHPAPWRTDAPVHTYERHPTSLVTELLEGPWPTARASLETGDYQLLDGHGKPLPEAVAPCIERKAAGDMIGSLTAGHDRFVDGEVPRLARFRTPLVIVEATIEWLLGARSPSLAALWGLREWAGGVLNQWEEESGTDASREHFAEARGQLRGLDQVLSGLRYEREAHRSGHKVRAMLGTLLSLYTDHRVLPLMLPDRRWAEYAAAWCLRRGWRRWLTEEWAAGRRESLEAVRAQRAGWAEPWRPTTVAASEAVPA